MVHIIVASKVELSGATDERCAEVELDDDVTLELVKVKGSVINYLTGTRPGVRQAVRGEVISRHKVIHRLILPNKSVVMVAIHVPHLQGEEQKNGVKIL